MTLCRETLQLSKTLRVIKRDLVKKCLEMSAETAEKNDDYIESNEQSGKCLKRENHDDSTIRARIAELLELKTSKSGDEQFSLKKYVDRMKEGHNDSFFFACESIAVVSSSLFNVPATPVAIQDDLYPCASRRTTDIVMGSSLSSNRGGMRRESTTNPAHLGRMTQFMFWRSRLNDSFRTYGAELGSLTDDDITYLNLVMCSAPSEVLRR